MTENHCVFMYLFTFLFILRPKILKHSFSPFKQRCVRELRLSGLVRELVISISMECETLEILGEKQIL
jgi:hypothetical protein